MIRSLALSASLCLVGAAPALAQSHPPDHAQGRPHHGAGHRPLDPSDHAAVHALLFGNWTGTSSSLEAASRELALVVAKDKRGNVTLKMKADQPIRMGASSSVAFEGDTIHWTQVVSGRSCKAAAVLSAATPLVPETMKGSMACENGEITFALQKTKG
jgi:hypothetical protein